MLHSYEEQFQVDFLDKIKRVKSKTQNKNLIHIVYFVTIW